MQMYLYAYAPFIQFMAAIYLVFFYQTMLGKRPLDSTKRKMDSVFLDLAVSFQGVIADHHLNSFIRAFNKSWDEYTEAVGCVARFSLVYSVTLLIYSCIEALDHIQAFQALLIDACIYVVYSIVMLYVLKSETLGSWKAWLTGMLLMMFVAVLFPPQPFVEPLQFWGMSQSTVVHLLALLTALPVVLALLRYFTDELHYKHIALCINKTRLMLGDFFDIKDKADSDTLRSEFIKKYGRSLNITEINGAKESVIDNYMPIVSCYITIRFEYWIQSISGKMMYQALAHMRSGSRQADNFRNAYPVEISLILIFLFLLVYVFYLS